MNRHFCHVKTCGNLSQVLFSFIIVLRFHTSIIPDYENNNLKKLWFLRGPLKTGQTTLDNRYVIRCFYSHFILW